MSKKIYVIISVLLITTIILVGCVPEEFKEGVKLDRDYPDDELPIMDDAVVYYCEEDDDTIEVEYGVSEDLDDVADFYKDFFEDNDIVPEDETDRSSKYSAESTIEDFTFSIKATDPSGKYEEKLFTTTVSVEIEFISDSEVVQTQAASSPEPSASPAPSSESGTIAVAPNQQLLERITNVAWYAFAEVISEDDSSMYAEDVTLTLKSNNSWVLDKASGSDTSGTWKLEGEVLYTDDGNEANGRAVVSQTMFGIKFMILFAPTGESTVYTDVSLIHGPVTLTEKSRLESALCDDKWYSTLYQYYSGNADVEEETTFVFHTDGKLEETYKGNLMIGKWWISGSNITLSFSDGDYTFPIHIEVSAQANYMTLYLDDQESGYWVYSITDPQE